MNDFMKRVERLRAALAGRERERPTLVYADGSQRSMGTLEAVDEMCKRDDIVDVLAQDDTTRSLLLAMRGPWDFSDREGAGGAVTANSQTFGNLRAGGSSFRPSNR